MEKDCRTTQKAITLFFAFLFMVNIASAQDWIVKNRIIASDGISNDRFGVAVDISGDYALVGADLTGYAYIYERNAQGNWVQVKKIQSSDWAGTGLFGMSVSISGNVAVVGASANSYDTLTANPLSEAGAAYVFERQSNGNWIQVQKLVAKDRAAGDRFGIYVSVSGNDIVVGSCYDSEDESGSNTVTNAGSAYAFRRNSSGKWFQLQKIVASDRAASDMFGYTVSVSGDYVAVGAFLQDKDAAGSHTLTDAGAVYVFQKTKSGTWSQMQKLVAADRTAGDKLSDWSLSISGNYIIAGSYLQAKNASGGDSVYMAGAAYIFEKNSSNNWLQVQKIVASDRYEVDRFGCGVSVSGDIAVVGAMDEDEDSTGGHFLASSGSAYIYKRDRNGKWNEVQKITSNVRKDGSNFGFCVGNDNERIIAGAYHEDATRGAAYIFERCSSASTLKINACETYTSPSGKYSWTQSGTYTDTLTNFRGCDSVITVQLTIMKHTSSINYMTSCDRFVSPSGKYTWTKSGTYHDTLMNFAGCDSVMTLYLTINKSSFSSIDTTVCGSFTSPSKRYTWTKSGTYSDTISNYRKCDSVIHIKLQVIPNSSRFMVVKACNVYTSPSGKYSWNYEGIYSDTIKNWLGCDSIILIQLYLTKYKDTIFISNNQLCTHYADSFQWLYCDSNFKAVAGATSQCFTPKANGNYAVRVVYDVCTDTSDCLAYNLIGISEAENNNGLRLWPNPSTGSLIVELRQPASGSISISDLSGKMLQSVHFSDQRQLSLDLDLPQGIYLLKVDTGMGVKVLKLMKE